MVNEVNEIFQCALWKIFSSDHFLQSSQVDQKGWKILDFSSPSNQKCQINYSNSIAF